MVHVTTGNKLDVVYEMEGDRKVIKGLWWHKECVLVPLPDPEGLLCSLRAILNCKKENDTNANTQN